jgi:hypothetical protein
VTARRGGPWTTRTGCGRSACTGRRTRTRCSCCCRRWASLPALRAAGARLAEREHGSRPGGLPRRPGATGCGPGRARRVRGAGRALRPGDLRHGARQSPACGPGHRGAQPWRAARADRRGPVRPGTASGACRQRLRRASRLPRLAPLGRPRRLAGDRAGRPGPRVLAGRPARLRRPAARRGDAGLVLHGAHRPLPRRHRVVRLRDRACGHTGATCSRSAWNRTCSLRGPRPRPSWQRPRTLA